MILTVTINPMLDKTVDIDVLRPGKIHRARSVHSIVGGKGVNVARQLTRFGAAALATGCLGGEVGLQLQRLLTAEGIPHDFFRIEGMTREGVTYRGEDGTWTAVFEPPNPVTPPEASAIAAYVASRSDRAGWIVCSGSSPCPEANGIFREVISSARRGGRKTWLDSYGDAFRLALESGPTVVQCNRAELEGSLNLPAGSEEEVREAFRLLLAKGVEMVVLTDGAERAYATDGTDFWAAAPPPVSSVNATGSGDSLAAGMLWKLEQGSPFEEAFRYGIAAGAANAARWGVAESDPAEVDSLVSEVRCQMKKPIAR